MFEKFPHIISVSAVVAERLLREEDGVTSAIRIVDVFYVPENLPDVPVNFNILLLIKSAPGTQAEHALRVVITNPSGESRDAKTADTKIPLSSKLEQAEIPGGATIVASMAIKPKVMGTYWIAFLLDGEEVARTPINFLRPLAPDPESE